MILSDFLKSTIVDHPLISLNLNKPYTNEHVVICITFMVSRKKTYKGLVKEKRLNKQTLQWFVDITYNTSFCRDVNMQRNIHPNDSFLILGYIYVRHSHLIII